MNAGNKCTLLAFLDRIGLYAEAEALIAREPSAEDLSKLLHAFLLTVPFENLGQHAHPALGDSVAAVPAAKHAPPDPESRVVDASAARAQRPSFSLGCAAGQTQRSLVAMSSILQTE